MQIIDTEQCFLFPKSPVRETDWNKWAAHFQTDKSKWKYYGTPVYCTKELRCQYIAEETQGLSYLTR